MIFQIGRHIDDPEGKAEQKGHCGRFPSTIRALFSHPEAMKALRHVAVWVQKRRQNLTDNIAVISMCRKGKHRSVAFQASVFSNPGV
jgi:RNase adaptor protein for sRNA GlmZ degradation